MQRSQVSTAVRELAKSDTTSLYARLGAYSEQFPETPDVFVTPNASVAVDTSIAGPLDDAAKLGKRILVRWHRTMFDLVCSENSSDREARSAIFNAVKLNSPEALAAAITGVLISSFSVAPAVAVVVGVLFGKVLLPAAGEEVCKFWAERL